MKVAADWIIKRVQIKCILKNIIPPSPCPARPGRLPADLTEGRPEPTGYSWICSEASSKIQLQPTRFGRPPARSGQEEAGFGRAPRELTGHSQPVWLWTKSGCDRTTRCSHQQSDRSTPVVQGATNVGEV